MRLLRLEFALVLALLFGPPIIDMWPTIAGAWPPDMLTFKYWQDGGANTSRSEVVRNLGLLLVAVFGIAIAWQRVKTANRQADTENEQAHIAQQGQVTDRFAKAVELLGSPDSAMVRTGAVYALGRIARDSIELDHIATMQVLCQFVCHSPYAETQEATADEYQENYATYINQKNLGNLGVVAPDQPPKRECPDILAALEVIAKRSAQQKEWELKQDSMPSLQDARLPWLKLPSVDFIHVQLSGADFRGADLRGAKFMKSELRWANFSGADLFLAKFTDADLGLACFERAQLIMSNLNGANLYGAIFIEANLGQARLIGANLSSADLTEASLKDANLKGADLVSTDLNNTKLTGAILSSGDFTGVRNLTQAQLDTAFLLKDQPMVFLPIDLNPPVKVRLDTE